jgi:hypothetical protein
MYRYNTGRTAYRKTQTIQDILSAVIGCTCFMLGLVITINYVFLLYTAK